ncbi:MAG TPA: sulfite exporter TauE/SafE family protein, partial [Acidimicrobiales bacterium]
GVRGFRRELRLHRTLLRSLVPTCVLGSVAGTAALLLGSNQSFTAAVPWLIGAATLLFALAPQITKMLQRQKLEDHSSRIRRKTLFVGVFLASVYGGYFGAGLGIVLLAVMALTLPFEIYEIQGLRSALAVIINAVAAIVFVIRGHLYVSGVVILLVSSFVGGLLGTYLIRKVSPKIVRILIVVVGVGTTIKLAIG